MTWTKDELDQALIEYEDQLVAAGRTPGTISTYVGDARRFVDWLSGDRPARASDSKRTGRPRAPLLKGRLARVGGLIPPPRALEDLVRHWITTGRPDQIAIAWPRDRWMNAFPQHRSMIGSLPDLLDRAAVRRIAARAADGEAASEAAFVATMTWGFGWVGYGPHRTAKMIALPTTRAHLLAVATSVRDEGAAAAYGRLARDCRVKGLGPAFGTKFIAFCQPVGARPSALIHDEMVSSWLATNGRPDLATASWSLPIYEGYLQQMHAWAHALELSPEAVEYLIFQSMADGRGGQWAGPR